MDDDVEYSFRGVIARICGLDWTRLSPDEMTRVAWAYYYFSVQFRENLGIARALYPDDAKLKQLEDEECNTSNLSPWPGVADPDEAMNHDEFMRRTLLLSSIREAERAKLDAMGQAYLSAVRAIDRRARAVSIASYEDGGLEWVFRAFLRAEHWDTPLLRAFEHFLTKHIAFDGDPEQGHGALSRHITVDDRILPLWAAFEELILEAVPSLAAARHGAGATTGAAAGRVAVAV